MSRIPFSYFIIAGFAILNCGWLYILGFFSNSFHYLALQLVRLVGIPYYLYSALIFNIYSSQVCNQEVFIDLDTQQPIHGYRKLNIRGFWILVPVVQLGSVILIASQRITCHGTYKVRFLKYTSR